MAKKKAAVEKKLVSKKTKKVKVRASTSVDSSLVAYQSTKPLAELAWDNKIDVVTVSRYVSASREIPVTTATLPITSFGFVVEDYNVPTGAPPTQLDFNLNYDTTTYNRGSLVLKSTPATGYKLRVTILTKKAVRP